MILNYRVLTVVGSFALFIFLSLSFHSDLTAATTIQTVSDTCYVTLDNGGTVYSSADHTALQNTIDLAPAGSIIKIAGECAGIQTIDGQTQTAYISKTLTLDGGYEVGDWSNPTSMSTLDAEENGRVIYITSGITVTLNRLIIQNGSIENRNGGGIYAIGTFANPTSLFLNQTWVTNNRTIGFFGSGAAIQSFFATINLDDSVIAHNSSTQNGGGIALIGSQAHLNMQASTIYSNTASRTGGAIFSSQPLNITNSSINNNSARDAGAIYSTNRLNISSSTIVSNTSDASGGVLGASANFFKNTILAHNTANGVLENCSGNAIISYGII